MEAFRAGAVGESEGSDVGEGLVNGLGDGSEAIFVADGEVLVDFAEELGESEGEVFFF